MSKRSACGTVRPRSLAVKRSRFQRVGCLRLRPRSLVTFRIAFAQRVPKLRRLARESDPFDAIRRVALEKPLEIFVLNPRDSRLRRWLRSLEGGIGAFAMRALIRAGGGRVVKLASVRARRAAGARDGLVEVEFYRLMPGAFLCFGKIGKICGGSKRGIVGMVLEVVACSRVNAKGRNLQPELRLRQTVWRLQKKMRRRKEKKRHFCQKA